MKRSSLCLVVFSIIMLCVPRFTFAAHPLISDDTGTQGKGKWQVEILGEYNFDNRDSLDPSGAGTASNNREAELKSAITYGILDNTDIVLTLPYQWNRKDAAGDVSSGNGFSDLSLEVKWRFFEKDGLGIAFKPGITFPSGDYEKDLGAGRTGCSLFLLATKELPSWAFNFNLGYKRNENKIDERLDIWHASVSGEYKVMKKLRLAGNIGAERNAEPGSRTAQPFALAGFIYSVAAFCDFNFGVKVGLNEPETDLALLTGLTFRF